MTGSTFAVAGSTFAVTVTGTTVTRTTMTGSTVAGPTDARASPELGARRIRQRSARAFLRAVSLVGLRAGTFSSIRTFHPAASERKTRRQESRGHDDTSQLHDFCHV